eukprot:Tbor_TRINITY_DN2532_c0_g1::TRINITY_DN2532_c0_g1_i1::g.436::m.436
MLNKVKGLFNKDEKGCSGGGSRIWKMPPTMRNEFEKGVKYNIKVVLRGMRRTGKSSVLARLHGHPFSSTYSPSQEIGAATIRFQNEGDSTDEGAKVEIWDVVDEGITTLKPTQQTPTGVPHLVADASNIDVYRNCHAAIFIVDVSRRETLDYVEKEAQNVPPTCAICIVMNFSDSQKPHAVSERDVSAVASKLRRCTSPLVHLASQGLVPHSTLSIGPTWLSVCAATGQGIPMLQSFFAIPVSLVKLETLETQMKSVYKSVELYQASLFEKKAMMAFEAKGMESQFSSGPSLATDSDAVKLRELSTFPSKNFDGSKPLSEAQIQEDFWGNSSIEGDTNGSEGSLLNEHQTDVAQVETVAQEEEVSVNVKQEDHQKQTVNNDFPQNNNIEFDTGDTYETGVTDSFYADVGDDNPSLTISDDETVVETISKQSRQRKSPGVIQVAPNTSGVKVDIDALLEQMKQIVKPVVDNEVPTKEKRNKKHKRKEIDTKDDNSFEVVE